MPLKKPRTTRPSPKSSVGKKTTPRHRESTKRGGQVAEVGAQQIRELEDTIEHSTASIWVDWDTTANIAPGVIDLGTRSEDVYDAITFQAPDSELFGVEDYTGTGQLLSGGGPPFDQQVKLMTSGLYMVSTYVALSSLGIYEGEIMYLEHRFPGPNDTSLGCAHHFHAGSAGPVVATEQFMFDPDGALFLHINNTTEGSPTILAASSIISKL